jgi:hypothetical protein
MKQGMQRQGVGRGKRMSQGKRGEGRVNHNTAPSTKGITRMKGTTGRKINKTIKCIIRMLKTTARA